MGDFLLNPIPTRTKRFTYMSDYICLEVAVDLRTLVQSFQSNHCISSTLNNMGFNKNHPFMASPGTKMSHIIEKVPLHVT